MNRNGREYGAGGCMCVNHFVIQQETNTTLEINYTSIFKRYQKDSFTTVSAGPSTRQLCFKTLRLVPQSLTGIQCGEVYLE